jgi:hypothetical protein
MYTTLNQIESHNPCTRGWRTLLKALGKTRADDEAISMAFILQSNGLDDALWALRCLEGADREIRLFTVDCARQMQHLMTDPRSLAALDVAERFAKGLATSEELDAARDAAWDAADASWDAADAARAAAWDAADAAWAAARDAARAAARAAAWAAARAAADAARDAADAAWAAARTKQEAIFLKYFGSPDPATSLGSQQHH